MSRFEGTKLGADGKRYPAGEEPIDRTLFNRSRHADDGSGSGGGITTSEATTVVLDSGTQTPAGSWFGDGGLFVLYEFTASVTASAPLFSPVVVEGAENNGYVELYLFEGPLVNGTVDGSADDIASAFSNEAGAQVVDFVEGTTYVVSIGLWEPLDEGTVVDVSSILYGLSEITDDLPDVGLPPLGLPLTVREDGDLGFVVPSKAKGNIGTGSFAAGTSNEARGFASFASGAGNVVEGTFGAAIGSNHVVSGRGAAAIGGYGAVVASDAGLALGIGAKPRWNTAVALQGKQEFPAVPGGKQYEIVTATGSNNSKLYVNGNQLLQLPSGTIAAFSAMVCSRNSTFTTAKAWKSEGLVAVSTEGVARLVDETTTVLGADAGASAWTLTVTFDSNGLNLQLGGHSGTVTIGVIQFAELSS